MSNVKSSKSSQPLFLIVSAIAIAASACKLDPPATTGGVGGNGQTCNPDDMGMPGTGGGAGTTGTGGGAGGNNIDNVVMAVACPGPMALPVEFKYAPGYTPDP